MRAKFLRKQPVFCDPIPRNRPSINSNIATEHIRRYKVLQQSI